MGAHPFVDGPVAGKRRIKRARVLLSARVRTGAGEMDVRLRDLSQRGALVEAKSLPPQGSEVAFCRGSINVPARVAWCCDGKAGLEFAYQIDESEVLVQLKRTTCDQNQPRFRRPRLFGEDMSAQEKKLAQMWGVSVGIAVPGE
ncbi:MAG TPA: PilZ domain-containing protein [Allosphingosinicella sp.]|nr:PilZ domain-containing protein [Allosphingosinicella sp.]